MTTLTVKIDERSRRRYGVREKEITFEELRRRIIGSEGLSSLLKANRAARKVGLRTLTLKQIDAEIKAARNGSRRS
jgi:hypothetical protein